MWECVWVECLCVCLQTRAKPSNPSEKNRENVRNLCPLWCLLLLVRVWSTLWVCVAVKRLTTLQVLRHVSGEAVITLYTNTPNGSACVSWWQTLSCGCLSVISEKRTEVSWTLNPLRCHDCNYVLWVLAAQKASKQNEDSVCDILPESKKKVHCYTVSKKLLVR